MNFGVNATANFTQLPGTILFNLDPTEWPLVLAQNEGFILRATVPATGNWVAFANVVWEEVTGLPY